MFWVIHVRANTHANTHTHTYAHLQVISGCLCLSMFVVSLLFMCHAGLYYFELFDIYAGRWLTLMKSQSLQV